MCLTAHFFTWSLKITREPMIKIALINSLLYTSNSYAGKEGKKGVQPMCSSFLANTTAEIDQEQEH
jgi:hypothetical protein